MMQNGKEVDSLLTVPSACIMLAATCVFTLKRGRVQAYLALCWPALSFHHLALQLTSLSSVQRGQQGICRPHLDRVLRFLTASCGFTLNSWFTRA